MGCFAVCHRTWRPTSFCPLKRLAQAPQDSWGQAFPALMHLTPDGVINLPSLETAGSQLSRVAGVSASPDLQPGPPQQHSTTLFLCPLFQAQFQPLSSLPSGFPGQKHMALSQLECGHTSVRATARVCWSRRSVVHQSRLRRKGILLFYFL